MTHSFAVIGYPITYSLSPWIHQRFMEETGIVGNYRTIEIKPEEDFAVAVHRLKEMELDGFNITAPYKETILPYLDEIDDHARKIGAVNTVFNKAGKWIGYNTDGIGYMRALWHHYPELEEKKDMNVLLLGAGGAAKGILHALVEFGYQSITIANRSLDKATQLASMSDHITVSSLEVAEERLADFSLIIQTTSVGMKPDSTKQIISLAQMKKDTIVSDIVYQPIMTALLAEAAERGGMIHFGHSMLLHQAQYAFEIWTNKRPETSHLEALLKKELEG